MKPLILILNGKTGKRSTLVGALGVEESAQALAQELLRPPPRAFRLGAQVLHLLS